MRPQPPQTDEEVVCPRCNLHFAPRRPGGGTDDAASSERPTVLVVEDMDFFREVAAEALAERFAVRTASTLQEARAALASGRVDLILLDLTLNGGEHGIDLLRDVGPSGVPVLIYTAQDESDMYGERWDDLRRLGATDVVAKGIHVGELLVRKATSLLGGRVEDLEPR